MIQLLTLISASRATPTPTTSSLMRERLAEWGRSGLEMQLRSIKALLRLARLPEQWAQTFPIIMRSLLPPERTTPAGTAPVVATAAFFEPNITATGTVTAATTLYIANAPTEGSSNYALWVDAGTSRFDGDVTVATDLTVTDQLIVSGAGPHAIGGAINSGVQLAITGSFSPSAA